MKYNLFLGNLILIIFLLLPNSTYCQSGAVFTGVFEGASDNGMVEILSTKGFRDSVHMKNGAFRFDLPAEDEWVTYLIKYGDKHSPFTFPVFLNRQSRLHMVVNKAFNQYVISGDTDAEEQDNFWKEYGVIASVYRHLQKEIADTKDVEKVMLLKEQLKQKEQQLNSYAGDWVLNHKKRPFSAAVIRLFISQSMPYGQDTTAEKYFNTLLPEAINNNYEAISLKARFKMYNDKYSDLPLGEKVRDFSIKDTSGSIITLKDLRAKYLLIDFWASWCSPCRAATPAIREMYDRYKDRGLDIISVSMDKNSKLWKAAIKDDKMIWLQGADLKGMEGGVGLDYQIISVPYYLLLDPERNVLWKSMAGTDLDILESKLRSIFGN